MPTMRDWFVGRKGPFSVVLTPQTVTAGVLADTTPVQTITGDIDEVTLENNPDLERIEPLNTTRGNSVLLADDWTMTAVEILKSSGTNMLAAACSAADYFKLVVVRGQQQFTFYCVRGRYSEGIRRGKSVATADFREIDPSATNPTYA